MRLPTALLTLVLLAPAAVAAPWQGFTTLVLSPEGHWLATGGREGEVLWFELETGELKGRWVLAGEKPIAGLAFDGERLGVVGLDGTVLTFALAEAEGRSLALTDPLAQKLLRRPEAWFASAPLASGVTLTSGGVTVAGRTDGRIAVTQGASEPRVWQAHAAVVTGLALSRDSRFLVSCGYDGTLCRWLLSTGEPAGRL